MELLTKGKIREELQGCGVSLIFINNINQPVHKTQQSVPFAAFSMV